jgi:catechol 2,3-dioxygenase-like lactoylglutathione lyase family enzyme
MTTPKKTRFENAQPILRVSNMSISVRYYVDVLGFTNAEWGTDDFTLLNRDKAFIYLCRGSQGQVGTWVWVGVKVFSEYKASGARITQPPRNYPWAYECRVEDPDGHVLRFGCEPKSGQPYDTWLE